MAWSPSSAASRDAAEQAAALVRDCRGLAILDWPGGMLAHAGASAEGLADALAGLGQAELRMRVLDLYAFLLGVQEAAFPTPAHAVELARQTDRLADLLPDGAPPRFIDLLTSRGPTPPALERVLTGAGHLLRRFGDVEALAAAIRRTPAAVLLVDAEMLQAAGAVLAATAAQVPAAAATVIVGIGATSPEARLKATLQGAEWQAPRLDDPALPGRVLELAAAPAESPYRVLVVDDDVHARRFIGLVLGQGGVQVDECSDPRAVAALLADDPPDLLVVDLYMPGIDGLALTRELRRQPDVALLPILFVSGEHDADARFQAIQAGADDFLCKPVPPRVLLGEVLSRIRRARMVRRQLPAVVATAPLQRRGGQLRRGDFLAQLADAQRLPRGPWQVLMSVKVDQAAALDARLGQAGAFGLEQQIAARFAGLLEPEDAHTIWLEFGFGILVQRDRAEQVTVLAQELCRCVAGKPFDVQGEPVALTVSIGVALPPTGEHAGNPDRWFAAAYAGMSIAHRLGGDRHDGVLTRKHGDMPAERVLIIREFVKNAARGEHIVIEFQPMLPLRADQGGQYALVTKLRDFRAPLAGIRRDEYLDAARDGGALVMIERMGVFGAFEAIEQERARGRRTRVLVPMDLESIDAAQLAWLAAELRRRRQIADGLVVEVDAEGLLAKPELVEVLHRLKACDLTLSLSEPSGSLARLETLQDLPADLLRLPHSAVDGVDPVVFSELLAPWRAQGRGIIVDQVRNLDNVTRLWGLGIDYLQGDALAAAGPRLDFDFSG